MTRLPPVVSHHASGNEEIKVPWSLDQTPKCTWAKQKVETEARDGSYWLPEVEASSFKPETLALHNIVGALCLYLTPGSVPVHCSCPPFLNLIYFTLGMVSALADAQVAHLHYPYPQT